LDGREKTLDDEVLHTSLSAGTSQRGSGARLMFGMWRFSSAVRALPHWMPVLMVVRSLCMIYCDQWLFAQNVQTVSFLPTWAVDIFMVNLTTSVAGLFKYDWRMMFTYCGEECKAM
jgi:hypothetical protein